MAEYHHNEPGRAWDEYDWERFLQQQDRKAERYMDLLEKYIDDPDRDQIIAREMGWNHWAESEEQEEPEVEADPLEADSKNFEAHPLYQACFALNVWLDQLIERKKADPGSPGMVKVTNQTAIANAKLAAALSDDDSDELGMTIAYLKRALKAITNALNDAPLLIQEARLSKLQARTLKKRLFQIRDGIILMMGEYRALWRQRFG